MKSNFKDRMLEAGFGSAGDNNFEQFVKILQMPDAEFDKVYPAVKEKLTNIFKGTEIQKDILRSLDQIPFSSLEEEVESVNEVLEAIKQDEDLSENKKDMLITLINCSSQLTQELKTNPRERIPVKVHRISPDAILPTYAHASDTGADIYSIADIIINGKETVIVPTGLTTAIPIGYEISIRPRSGLSLKTNLRIANSPASIDASYRGEIGVIITNTGTEPITIKKGDRIAQMVIAPSPMITWEEVDSLDETERAEGGYGSTGTS